MKRNQAGFTLIELIMVIVILGILSAFALPRFADFGDNASTASLEGARASVQSANGIVRSKALVEGLGSTSGSVTLEGNTSVSVANGYLAADSVSVAGQLTDFTTETSGASAYVTLGTAETDSPCFTFVQGTPPQISAVSTAWDTSTTPDSCGISP